MNDDPGAANANAEHLDAQEIHETVLKHTQALRTEIARAIVGQEQVVREVLLALLCRGHGLLIGVPGLAKTLLVSTVARSLGLEFSRIQFTPDLMPSDITGTEVIEENRDTGRREMRFVRGPLFANIILADEINRTPPKTQAALLEAMQERHVTASGVRHDLSEPFFVLATQNPIEQEGTYPLPEAQLDRFMVMIRVDYPSHDEEAEIIRRTTTGTPSEITPVLDADQIRQLQDWVRAVPVPDHTIDYALRLTRSTRKPGRGEPDHRPAFVRDYLAWGAGPRATQNLILAAKASALLDGRNAVTIQDIQAVTHPVMRHRMHLNFQAEADRILPDDLIDQLVRATPENADDTQPAAMLSNNR
ncbi:AAA family ATPase [Mucisphaera calidilacus]|uniref:ATPase RavA n=1 Tax=Mucisphaera calidilacus TaxID=2527982 RepID=A0A518C0W6_9BACT|nr:MoxR family ATPase [Mucisphaera calidilacus]QDU72866.1 ATPase RavA [Mucisphaera calidilacus]